MSAPALRPPAGISLDEWGPKVFPGGTLYLYQGERKVIPITWKDIEGTVKNLSYLEKFEWAHALPHQRQELFNKKLEALTRNAPTNWTFVLCAVASGLIIFVGVVSIVQSQIAKL